MQLSATIERLDSYSQLEPDWVCCCQFGNASKGHQIITQNQYLTHLKKLRLIRGKSEHILIGDKNGITIRNQKKSLRTNSSIDKERKSNRMCCWVGSWGLLLNSDAGYLMKDWRSRKEGTQLKSNSADFRQTTGGSDRVLDGRRIWKMERGRETERETERDGERERESERWWRWWTERWKRWTKNLCCYCVVLELCWYYFL